MTTIKEGGSELRSLVRLTKEKRKEAAKIIVKERKLNSAGKTEEKIISKLIRRTTHQEKFISKLIRRPTYHKKNLFRN